MAMEAFKRKNRKCSATVTDNEGTQVAFSTLDGLFCSVCNTRYPEKRLCAHLSLASKGVSPEPFRKRAAKACYVTFSALLLGLIAFSSIISMSLLVATQE